MRSRRRSTTSSSTFDPIRRRYSATRRGRAGRLDPPGALRPDRAARTDSRRSWTTPRSNTIWALRTNGRQVAGYVTTIRVAGAALAASGHGRVRRATRRGLTIDGREQSLLRVIHRSVPAGSWRIRCRRCTSMPTYRTMNAGIASTTATSSSTGRSASTLAFTEFARGLIEDAFAPLDPRAAQFELPVEQFVEIVAPLQPRFIHHPGVEAPDRGDARRDRLRPRRDLLRRPAHASAGARRLPDRGRRLPAPPAPRHLVRGAAVAGELVAAGVPDHVGEHVRVLPEVLPPPGRRTTPTSSTCTSGTRSRARTRPRKIGKDIRWQPTAQEPLDLETEFRVVVPAGRPDHVLGRAPARDGAEHVGLDPLQRRLPHGAHRRRRGTAGCAEARLVRAGHDAARAPARPRPRTAARGPGSALRPEPAEDAVLVFKPDN